MYRYINSLKKILKSMCVYISICLVKGQYQPYRYQRIDLLSVLVNMIT